MSLSELSLSATFVEGTVLDEEKICSERPITICAIVKGWTCQGHVISMRSRGKKDKSGLSYRLHYRKT